MLVYFDESYNQRYMLYGALFNPHSKQLHRLLTAAKEKHDFKYADGSYKELKYSTTTTNKQLRVAKEAVDIFMRSTSYFRAVIIDQENFDYGGFGRPYEPLAIKKARAYKKFAEMLLQSNTRNIKEGVLLCDNLTRCRGDLFVEKMKELFMPHTFRDIKEIDSGNHETQVNQINDILLGSVLNAVAGSSNRRKIELRDYVIQQTGVPSLDMSYWKSMSKTRVEDLHPKLQVWVFKAGISTRKKAREM